MNKSDSVKSTSNLLHQIKESAEANWLPLIYLEKVRSIRTRAFRLDIAEKEHLPEIQHTLLGVELKIGKKRLSCPDLSTARYLQVFARIGCVEIAIPYDITKISTLADELESAWHKILILFEHLTREKIGPPKNRLRSNLIAEMRRELNAIGAGEAMPEFNQNTKQNLYRGKK